jgi:hypothetical protein
MELLPLLALPLLVVWGVLYGIGALMYWIATQVRQYRQRRRDRIEAELDRAEAELKATLYELASQLSQNAHEARKALIRESFLTAREHDSAS